MCQTHPETYSLRAAIGPVQICGEAEDNCAADRIPVINELIAWLPRHCTVGKLDIEVRADSENGCDYDPDK